jgi:hypothetical protein
MEPDLLKDLDLTEAEEAFLKDAHSWSLANINQSRVASELYLVKVLREMIHKLIESNEKIEQERRTLELTLILISAFSVFVAACALIASARSVGILSAQLSDTRQFHWLSLKPATYFETILSPTPPWPQFGLYLTNNGTGMAILEDTIVFVNDQPVQLEDRYFERVVRQLGLLEEDSLPFSYTSLIPNVLAPGERLPLIVLDNEHHTPEVKAILEETLAQITKMEFTYKSLYEETVVAVYP